jgi:hypothetical protein
VRECAPREPEGFLVGWWEGMGMTTHTLKVGTLLTAIFLAVSLTAFSQNIVSRPVGFVRVEVPAQGQALVSLPFEPFDEDINSVLADQLTGGTNASTADAVVQWDSVNSVYVSAVKVADAGHRKVDGNWVSDLDSLKASKVTLLPGEGFYILNKQYTNQTVILSGDVLLAATNEMTLAPSLNLIGYPFSTSARLEDTALGDKVEGTDVLELGKGYWCEVAGDAGMVWAEVRPYAADVFPVDDTTPQITGMSGIDGGSAVKLMIRCAGAKGEKLDIFYQDVPIANRFDTLNGWQIAVSNWDLGGKTEVAWEDHGGDTRPPVDQAEARYFLVARADIDSDGDGIPDARERFVYGTDPLKKESSGLPINLAQTTSAISELALAGTNLLNSGAVKTNASLPGISFIVGRIIYVDKHNGSDALSGRAIVVTSGHGPKKTIKAGLNVAKSGDALVIKSGHYGENLNIAGRDISVVIAGNVDISGHCESPVVQKKPRVVPDSTNIVGVSTNFGGM